MPGLLFKKKDRLSSSITHGLKAEVRKFAKKRKVSMSRYTEQALKEKIARERVIFKKSEQREE